MKRKQIVTEEVIKNFLTNLIFDEDRLVYECMHNSEQRVVRLAILYGYCLKQSEGYFPGKII